MKVYGVNFSVSSVYGDYEKVICVFAKEEDAKNYIRKEGEKRFNVLQDKGYIKRVDDSRKIALEQPESGEYEEFYLQEWEVK